MTLPTLGLEEEFFVLYDGRPSTASLLDLARLLWRDPRHNASHTATNFTRGPRAWRGLMSSVEVATRVHHHPDALLADVARRRADLTGVLRSGLIAPVGLLPDSDRYHTAGLHLHLGVPAGQLERAYGNIARFLPVLALASASSPWWGGREGGPMQRVPASFALGPLGHDPYARFQDLIVTRRLGTIELRVLDPVWDLGRLRAIVDAAWQLAALPERLAWSPQTYNRLRGLYPHEGLTEETHALALELQDRTGFDARLAEAPEATRLAQHARAAGFADLWRHLDGGVRAGRFAPSSTPDARPARWRGAAGFAAYYLPKLPYITYKAWQEHHGRPPAEGARGTPPELARSRR